MLRKLLALSLALFIASPAFAQFTSGGSFTAGGSSNQIQYYGSGGQFSGFTMSGDCTITVSTGVIVCGQPFAEKFTTFTSTSGSAALNIPQGSTPSAPANGDVWTTSSGLYVQIGGVTVGPLAANGTNPLATPAVSGNFYMPPYVITATSAAATGSRMICTEQINNLTSLTVKGLFTRVVAAGSSNTQIAIYANSGGFPNGAPLGSTGNLANNSSNTTIGTTGDVTNFSLPVGPYWACVVSNDSTVTFMGISVLNGGSGAATLTGTATLANMIGSNLSSLSKFQAITFGSWPTATSSGWSEGSTTQAAMIVLQAN